MPPAAPSALDQVEFGNAHQVDTQGTGWFIGFSDWTRSGGPDLRHMPADVSSTGLCVKWFMHAAGDPDGQDKPLSTGRTISMLTGPASEFRIAFCATPDFIHAATLVHTLREPGDFVIWGAGLYHRAYGLKPSCILTIRWEPQA